MIDLDGPLATGRRRPASFAAPAPHVRRADDAPVKRGSARRHSFVGALC